MQVRLDQTWANESVEEITKISQGLTFSFALTQMTVILPKLQITKRPLANIYFLYHEILSFIASTLVIFKILTKCRHSEAKMGTNDACFFSSSLLDTFLNCVFENSPEEQLTDDFFLS